MQEEQSEASDSFGKNAVKPCWEKFVMRLNEIMRDIYRFAGTIPGFEDLEYEDRVTLIKKGIFEVSWLFKFQNYFMEHSWIYGF